MALLPRLFNKPDSDQKSRKPRHVAIIMDGNGRWARRRGLPRTAGHRVGLSRMEEIISAALDFKLDYLTVYAFSTENWRRSEGEVGFLMNLFAEVVADKGRDLHAKDVKVQFIGRKDRVPAVLAERMRELESLTMNNKALHFIVALDYGGREEIVAAVRALAADSVAGGLRPEEIDAGVFAEKLYTAGIPDPDLIIRPSGELRLSNFLLWQAAYAELYFTPVQWPDFRRKDLQDALADYDRRDRRYGGVK